MTDQVFHKEDVPQILSHVTGVVESEVRQGVANLVEDAVNKFLFGLVNMSTLTRLGVPQVMLRVQTFQTILDDFRANLGGQYDKALYEIGRNVGFNFSISLLRILRNAGKLPRDYPALLDFWASFDSSAHMGEFRFEMLDVDANGQAVIHVKIKDLFLTLGYDDEPLRHAPFITGYLEAAVDCAFLLWTRWIRDSDFKDPDWLLGAVECINEGHDPGGVTSFRVSVAQERAPGIRDRLNEAIRASEADNWSEAILKARGAMERTLLLVAGEAMDAKYSFARLLDALRSVRVPLDYDGLRDVYDYASSAIHQRKAIGGLSASRQIFRVWSLVKDAGLQSASKEQGEEIRKERGRYIQP